MPNVQTSVFRKEGGVLKARIFTGILNILFFERSIKLDLAIS